MLLIRLSTRTPSQRRPAAPSLCPLPRRGLWSGRPEDGRSLFRGKCRSETLAVQARGPFRGSAKHSRPWQGLVQQRVTNPGGTAGLSTPKHRRYGSDPPENGPSLHARPFGEVAPGIFPCRKAGRPPGRPGRRRPWASRQTCAAHSCIDSGGLGATRLRVVDDENRQVGRVVADDEVVADRNAASARAQACLPLHGSNPGRR